MVEQPNIIDPLFKLRNSPLQGVEAYRSPFYRRLLSAGYKGYIQGSLGGATLFSLFGAGAGILLAGGAVAFAGASLATAFIAVPIMAGAGLLYGKDAFGTIGAVAAISAEQAEISEKRRSLLDRWFETPSKEEAREIENQLREQSQERKPQSWFHWKAALLGAAIVGIAAAGGLGALAYFDLLSKVPVVEAVITKILGIGTAEIAKSTAAYAITGIAGGLAGAMIGIDRAYIRKWFDIQERFHDETDIRNKQAEHQQEVERIRQAYRAEGFGIESRSYPADSFDRDERQRIQPVSTRIVQATPASQEKPTTTISATDAELQRRAANITRPLAAL